MTNQGDFAAHHRDDDHVIKVLDARHPAGARFVTAALAAGRTGMDTYLSTLRAADVILPPDLAVVSVEPLAVRHRWVTGPVLLDYASVDPSSFVGAVAEIARWVHVLGDTDARLDTNLANFCLADGQVVLVDVLPPLVPSAGPEPSNLFEVLFSALCFDTAVIHDALIGYAARALLRSVAGGAARQRGHLARQIRPAGAEPAGSSFPASWFRARAALACVRSAEMSHRCRARVLRPDFRAGVPGATRGTPGAAHSRGRPGHEGTCPDMTASDPPQDLFTWDCHAGDVAFTITAQSAWLAVQREYLSGFLTTPPGELDLGAFTLRVHTDDTAFRQLVTTIARSPGTNQVEPVPGLVMLESVQPTGDRCYVIARDSVAVPLPVPTARGTIEAFPELKRSLRRARAEAAELGRMPAAFGSTVKHAFAARQFAQAFSAGLASTSTLRLVVVPQFADNCQPARLRHLSEKAAREVVAANCFTPRDEFWVRPWLIPRQKTGDLLRDQARTAIQHIAGAVPCVEVSFGVRNPITDLEHILVKLVEGVR